jgi:hypothetical protein
MQWQDVGVPSTPLALDRRHVLAAGGLLAVLTAATSACGSAPPPIDKLQSQRQLAVRDSELATAAAATAPPAIAPALTEVAAERAEHAHALAAEIARVTGDAEPAPTETSEVSGSTGTAAPAPGISDVVDALRDAADSAGVLATEVSGYRAGLLASVAAACTAACTVTLVKQP